MGFPHPFELFSLHLYGRAQDFVEILMDLWPRFCACVCVCVWCMSVLPLPAEETHWWGGGELSRNVVLSRISVTWISCLRETVFTPKGNNEARERNPADERACGCTFKFQHCAVYNNLPLIYSFMKDSPVGFWVCCKSCFVWRSKGLKSQTDRSRKWRTHHWQSCHGLVYALTG